MNTRNIVIRAVLALIGLPIVLGLLAFGFFYSVFYFPNWTGATTGTIISSGQKRKYLLYVPKSYDLTKPTPLVITLHTSMSWDSSAMAISQWDSVADENGFIIVYPEGTGFGPKSWEMTGSETPSRMPDVTFISQLIDKLEASYNIDQTRIYANGMSNGGGMAFVLSCTLSDRIAAVGMASAGLDPGWDWCKDHRPVPVISFHGTADPVCPYNGGYSKLAGGTFPSVPGFMANWSRRNQCRPKPIESTMAPDVTRLRYSDCADNADVVLYTVKGEGHQWPGGKRVAAEWMLGRYSHTIDATRQMWASFVSIRLGESSLDKGAAMVRNNSPSQIEVETSRTQQSHPLWLCPKYGGPMAVIERLTAAQLQVRSPSTVAHYCGVKGLAHNSKTPQGFSALRPGPLDKAKRRRPWIDEQSQITAGATAPVERPTSELRPDFLNGMLRIWGAPGQIFLAALADERRQRA